MISTSPDATARVVQGVITGVGFIGGGAILNHGSFVHGTATAASIRATVAIGPASVSLPARGLPAGPARVAIRRVGGDPLSITLAIGA